MKISLKLEYACRVLAQMGRRYGSGEWAQIEELAQIENVPRNYLVQILNMLRTGGLLDSRRGKQGGYTLARPPAEISLHDVVAIVEPELISSRAALEGESGPQVAEVWNTLSSRIAAYLKKTTLTALIATYNDAAMYDI